MTHRGPGHNDARDDDDDIMAVAMTRRPLSRSYPLDVDATRPTCTSAFLVIKSSGTMSFYFFQFLFFALLSHRVHHLIRARVEQTTRPMSRSTYGVNSLPIAWVIARADRCKRLCRRTSHWVPDAKVWASRNTHRTWWVDLRGMQSILGRRTSTFVGRRRRRCIRIR